MTGNIKIQHWAVVSASVVNFLLAFIWYGPLFGDAWVQGAEVANPSVLPTWATISSFIVGLFCSYGIAFILKWKNQTGLVEGLKVGFFVSGVFLLQIVIGPWLFAGRFLLFAVNMPYFLLTAVIAGGNYWSMAKTSIIRNLEVLLIIDSTSVNFIQYENRKTLLRRQGAHRKKLGW